MLRPGLVTAFTPYSYAVARDRATGVVAPQRSAEATYLAHSYHPSRLTRRRSPGDEHMLKKLMQSAAALVLVLGIAAATSQQADAHRRGGGVAAGVAIGTILGLGIAGAYAGPRYYDGPACYP